MLRKVTDNSPGIGKVGRKADKVKRPLKICFLFHSAARADQLCLVVLHNAVDENNHLTHGQV